MTQKRSRNGQFVKNTAKGVTPPPSPAEPLSGSEATADPLIAERKAAHRRQAEAFRKAQQIHFEANHEKIQQLRRDSLKTPRF